MKLLTRIIAVIAVISAAFALTAPAIGQPLDIGSFEAYARDSMAAYDVPGASVAIVKDGAVVYAGGFGVRTLGRGAAVDADTLFAIASMSKAFTAAVLASLVDEGALDWDDRVSDRMPAFRLSDAYRTREMTVRDLLSHRSGNATGIGDLLWLRSTYTREEITERVRFIEPAHGFRARYGYSNVFFIVAGELAAAVADRSWDELVRTRIFEPAGMSSSNTSISKRTDGANWATPHVRVNGAVQPIAPENVDNLGGAGAINSSAADMARWLLLQLGRGTIDGKRVFENAQSKLMWTPHINLGIGTAAPELAVRQPRFSAYGLGWRLKDYRSRKLVHHGGGLAGMTSLTTLVPEENLGVVVLTNQETSVQTALTYWVLDRFFGAPRTDWTKAQQIVAERRWTERMEPRLNAIEKTRIDGTSPRLKLGDYSGRYEDRLVGAVDVALVHGALKLLFVKSPPFNAVLEHWHHDTFVARFHHHSIADAFVTFVLGPNGKVAEMKMSPYSPYSDSAYHYDALRFVKSP